MSLVCQIEALSVCNLFYLSLYRGLLSINFTLNHGSCQINIGTVNLFIILNFWLIVGYYDKFL